MANAVPVVVVDEEFRFAYNQYVGDPLDKMQRDAAIEPFYPGFPRVEIRRARAELEWLLVTEARDNLMLAVQIACADNYPIDQDLGLMLSQNLKVNLLAAMNDLNDPAGWVPGDHAEFLNQLRISGTRWEEYHQFPQFTNHQLSSHYKRIALNVLDALFLNFPNVLGQLQPAFNRLIMPALNYPHDWAAARHEHYKFMKIAQFTTNQIRQDTHSSSFELTTHHRKTAVRVFDTLRFYLL